MLSIDLKAHAAKSRRSSQLVTGNKAKSLRFRNATAAREKAEAKEAKRRKLQPMGMDHVDADVLDEVLVEKQALCEALPVDGVHSTLFIAYDIQTLKQVVLR